MEESRSERRLAENEVVFRRANEKVIETLNLALKEEEDDKVQTKNKDLVLHFLCECADDKCLERIKLRSSEYESIHSQSNLFIIVPGHEIPEIEKVTKKAQNYYVVQKYMTPPKNVSKLHSAKKNIKRS